MKTKNKKAISTLIAVTIAFSILVAFSATASAADDVCPSGCSYTLIQAAINDANPGDTITVGAGTYAENIIIGTADLTLQSETHLGAIIQPTTTPAWPGWGSGIYKC